jgi:hypothetical protein
MPSVGVHMSIPSATLAVMFLVSFKYEQYSLVGLVKFNQILDSRPHCTSLYIYVCVYIYIYIYIYIFSHILQPDHTFSFLHPSQTLLYLLYSQDLLPLFLAENSRLPRDIYQIYHNELQHDREKFWYLAGRVNLVIKGSQEQAKEILPFSVMSLTDYTTITYVQRPSSDTYRLCNGCFCLCAPTVSPPWVQCYSSSI